MHAGQRLLERCHRDGRGVCARTCLQGNSHWRGRIDLHLPLVPHRHTGRQPGLRDDNDRTGRCAALQLYHCPSHCGAHNDAHASGLPLVGATGGFVVLHHPARHIGLRLGLHTRRNQRGRHTGPAVSAQLYRKALRARHRAAQGIPGRQGFQHGIRHHHCIGRATGGCSAQQRRAYAGRTRCRQDGAQSGHALGVIHLGAQHALQGERLAHLLADDLHPQRGILVVFVRRNRAHTGQGIHLGRKRLRGHFPIRAIHQRERLRRATGHGNAVFPPCRLESHVLGKNVDAVFALVRVCSSQVDRHRGRSRWRRQAQRAASHRVGRRLGSAQRKVVRHLGRARPRECGPLRGVFGIETKGRVHHVRPCQPVLGITGRAAPHAVNRLGAAWRCEHLRWLAPGAQVTTARLLVQRNSALRLGDQLGLCRAVFAQKCGNGDDWHFTPLTSALGPRRSARAAALLRRHV